MFFPWLWWWLFYSMPTWSICIFAAPLPGVLVLCVTFLSWSTQLRLYGGGCCWHYILMNWCGGYLICDSIPLLYVTCNVHLGVFFYLAIVIMCHNWLGLIFAKCFRMSSIVSTVFLLNWPWRYCSVVMGVSFMYFLYHVTVHPVFVMHIIYDLLLWLCSPLPPFCAMGPWSTIFTMNY